MQKRAIEVLERLRRSTAKPRLSVDHIIALIDDYDKLGRDQFLSEVKQIFNTSNTPGAPKDPLIISFENLQGKTKLDRKTFLAHVVERITSDNDKIARLPKSQQTLPKLIAFYEPKLGKAKLESCAASVANEYSIVH